jgi:hypothetical protein
VSRAQSPLAGKLIFAVGAPRSGTNWLQRVLSAHPRVVAVPSETYMFSHGLRQLAERFHQGALSSSRTAFVYAHNDDLLDAMRDLCDVVFGGLMRGLDPQSERIVERTPEHVRHLDLIGAVYPDAHIVHIVRDGRDVVRSLLSHEWGPGDARAAAEDWRSAITSARAAAASLANYHEVSYEAMLTDPRTHVAALFEAVGLPLGPHEVDPVLTEAGVGYNTDPSAPSIESGKWRTGLDPQALAIVDEVAGDVLAELGYEASDAAAPPRAQPQAAVARPRTTLRQRAAALRRKDEPVIKRAEVGQQVLDAFLSAAANAPSTVGVLLTPGARVRIVDGDERSEARGEEARRRLIEELTADEALRGAQSFGFVHPSVPAAVFVGEFEHDGRTHPRVFALTIVRTGLIDRVAYYRFPPR